MKEVMQSDNENETVRNHRHNERDLELMKESANKNVKNFKKRCIINFE